MNWKLKAKIQNLVSLLPPNISFLFYNWIQRNFGSLKKNKLNPISRLQAGIETCKRIEKLGQSPVGATFLEVGTGWRINTPLAFWLLGAERIITVDLNPYLKEELVKADLEYIKNHATQIEDLFENRIVNNRLNLLISFTQSPFNFQDLLQFINVDYIAPGDASQLSIPSNSIDFHTSYTVFEHIPPEIIKAIIKEGKRVLKSNGLFVHKIDYSDHFSHSDKSISAINFLQFSDSEWNRIAGNRYMYMNRLRHDDFRKLFVDLDTSILLDEVNESLDARSSLNEITLDSFFSQKDTEILGITSAWIVSHF
ncbi:MULTISPECIES: methyltransferase domain-containing protein [Cyanophyceae]|uniref:methyltransferase domain-containing protein n=1 Tax=Cyanophyceae TaxID=3028117 RepID=UPI002330B4D1|nr:MULTISPECIES: methyltransferase domain-containing protein [Cyanophyceae]MDB9356909.1 methyltransferase domain-containing protein [Nodularia spumigena CS-587/03]MDB9337868.1 methyltransferase domain-containing protein [Nodularia spumigena CS-589/07]MDB9402183.1 methyltransferase domain-containing protein [Microcystis aeruginosa CS-567/02-A1]MDB9500028.1 methyltransferase domain-containing protein [Nodularia spumigena CS-336/02]MDB9532093.1 methyltransferase domain-containing protein [Nodular